MHPTATAASASRDHAGDASNSAQSLNALHLERLELQQAAAMRQRAAALRRRDRLSRQQAQRAPRATLAGPDAAVLERLRRQILDEQYGRSATSAGGASSSAPAASPLPESALAGLQAAFPQLAQFLASNLSSAGASDLLAALQFQPASGLGSDGSHAAAAAASTSAMAAAATAAAAAARPPVVEQDETDPDAVNFQTDQTSEVVFHPYVCRSISYGTPHPCEVTEAGTLSGVSLPPATYPLRESLPASLIEDGILSSLQLEGVLYAAQRHQQFLSDGVTRAGFFLADGAGVGKGRQLAAMCFDSILRGNSSRHVWFSVSTDLHLEATRDLTALGCQAKVINGLQSIDERVHKNWSVAALPSSLRRGVLFSTYSTLVSGLKATRGGHKESRLDQIVKWCGGAEFEGLLIFDECHRAKNTKMGADGTVDESSSQTGLAVVKLQELLPRARVVYASATGVTDIKNMAFMTRLGLWGPGCGFVDFPSFERSVKKRGIGAFELLSMELKHAGVYVSRGLSYASCEYIYVNAELNDEMRRIYDTLAHWWLDLKEAFQTAIDMTGSEKSVWKQFWNAHLRFFGLLCSSVKVQAIVAEAKKAIEEGYAVVIGLQSTGESSMAHESAKVLESRSRASNNPPKRPRGEHHASAQRQRAQRDSGDDDDDGSDDSWSDLDQPRSARSAKASAAAASSQSFSAASAAGGDRAEFPSLYRESLCRFLLTHFPVYPHVPKSKAEKAAAAAAKKPRGRRGVNNAALEQLLAKPAAAASAPPVDHAGTEDVPHEWSPPSTPNSVLEVDHAPNGDFQPAAAAAAASSAAPVLDPSQSIPAAVALRETFLARIADMTLPCSPLDELLDSLGGREIVAEMTGRHHRYVRDSRGRIILETRGSGGTKGKLASNEDATADVNIAERNLFMSGRKLIAIISDAASTGISLHADRAVRNQRRRMHLTMELPWSADKAIQQLGRTHRSNEVTGVLYALVISSLGGERRFASACAARLQSLGALTKGDRRAATGSNLAQYDIDTDYGRKALRKMATHIFSQTTALPQDTLDFLQANGVNVLPESEEEATRLKDLDAKLFHEPPSAKELAVQCPIIPHPAPWSVHNTVMFSLCLEAMGFDAASISKMTVKTFLNRLLGLPHVKQNLLFEYFMMVLNHAILEAKKEGTYHEAVSDLTAESIKVESRQTLAEMVGRSDQSAVAQSHDGDNDDSERNGEAKSVAAASSSASSHFGAPGSQTTCWRLSLDRGISFKSASERLRSIAPEQESPWTSFYLGIHPVTNQKMPLLAIQKSNHAFQFQVFRPNSGRASVEMSKAALTRTYNRVSAAEVECDWTALYDLTLKHCTHGPRCKLGAVCTHGRRVHHVNLVGGHVLNYLGDLTSLADRYAHQLSVNERSLKVVRVDTDAGERLVGLAVPQIVLRAWLDELRGGSMALSSGLGAPAAAVSDQPRQPQAELVHKYAVTPSLLASQTSFFGGGSPEATSHSLLGGASYIAAASSHDVKPHQLASSHKQPPLHSLVTAQSQAHSQSTVTKKQTCLSSFFSRAPPAAKSLVSTFGSVKTEAARNHGPTPASPLAAVAAAAAAAPSPKKPTAFLRAHSLLQQQRPTQSQQSQHSPQQSQGHARPSSPVIVDLISSESESESVAARRRRQQMSHQPPPGRAPIGPLFARTSSAGTTAVNKHADASLPTSSVPAAVASFASVRGPSASHRFDPIEVDDDDDFEPVRALSRPVTAAAAATPSTPTRPSRARLPAGAYAPKEDDADDADDVEDEDEDEDEYTKDEEEEEEEEEQEEEDEMRAAAMPQSNDDAAAAAATAAAAAATAAAAAAAAAEEEEFDAPAAGSGNKKRRRLIRTNPSPPFALTSSFTFDDNHDDDDDDDDEDMPPLCY